MEQGKIVALEDRIPKLKEQRRRKANKRLILLLLLFFTMIVAVAYTQSPLSRVKQILVKGNDNFYTAAELAKVSGITTSTNIWKVNTGEAASTLDRLPEIKQASVYIKWPNTILIQVQVHKRIAYLKKDSVYYPILENGKVLEDRKLNILPANSPILYDFKEGPVLDEMVTGLKNLPEEILNSISEIRYSPDKTDKSHISLFMNDGFEVSATLDSFSDKMVHYPSIISQLDPNKKGIIDLEVGSFFKAYSSGSGGKTN